MSKVSGLFQEARKLGPAWQESGLLGDSGKREHCAWRSRGTGMYYPYLDDFFMPQGEGSEYS